MVMRFCRTVGYAPALGPEFTNDQDTLAAIGHGKPSWTVSTHRMPASSLSPAWCSVP
ncbi:hypothetical protein [Streptomyces sp. NPDC048248]|uniref:hypothetical protein n=1 Tax=Streptomyces sp. NPDC048248 TaxID=3365523 RepID=UPI003714681C